MRPARACAIAATLCLLAAPAFASAPHDITGHLPDLHFTLTDDNGRTVTERDYIGQTVLLYFGFTGCTAQCPATMAQLTALLQQLGPGASRVRVLFVTVTPETDTPAQLRAYLAAFTPSRMTGLTASPQAVETTARLYRASATAQAHSTAIYIFDASGHARFLAMPGDSTETLLENITRLDNAR